MGYISMNKGKWIFPVPWKTGVHFSHKRLQEFIHNEGIKPQIKMGIMKYNTTAGKQSKSESLPRHSAQQDHCDEPAVSYKDILKEIETPNYKYKEDEAKAIRKSERESIKEQKRIPELNHFYPTRHLTQINRILPKIPKPKKLPSIIRYSPLYIYKSLTSQKIIKPKKYTFKDVKSEPSELIVPLKPITQEPIEQKPSQWKSKFEPIVTSNIPESALKIAIALLVILIPLGFITIGGLIFTALFMPEWLVGGVEYVPKPLNTTTINETINPNIPTAIGSSGTTPIVVNVPSSPQQPIIVKPNPTIPSTPTQTKPVNTTPQQPTQFKDTKGTVRNINELTSYLKYQINYQCYWDLRDKGFGKGLDVEYACNSQETGLWMEACTCCKLIGRCS